MEHKYRMVKFCVMVTEPVYREYLLGIFKFMDRDGFFNWLLLITSMLEPLLGRVQALFSISCWEFSPVLACLAST